MLPFSGCIKCFQEAEHYRALLLVAFWGSYTTEDTRSSPFFLDLGAMCINNIFNH